jgi:DNA-binding XRE family transcriptional regulator
MDKFIPINTDTKDLEKLFKDYVKIMNKEISVEIEVKIKDKVEEFQKRTGVNKGFIAKRLGISKAALSEAFKSNNPRLETLIKFAICLDCKVEDLYDYYQKTGFENNSDIPEK